MTAPDPASPAQAQAESVGRMVYVLQCIRAEAERSLRDVNSFSSLRRIRILAELEIDSLLAQPPTTPAPAEADSVTNCYAMKSPAEARVVFAERAHYREPGAEVSLVGKVFEDGVRIGCEAVEPWYGTGVLIPPTHPAYPAAVAFLAALAEAGREEEA